MTALKERHETRYVTISADEYESMKRTIEVLSDKELMEQIRASRTAKARPWKKVKKDLKL
jgi:PHD/YefM family antitoxin component YafN of YafNO toxin-antitoxin module